MPPVVQSWTNDAQLNSATLTPAQPAGVTAGDLLIVLEGNDSQTATAQFDDVTYKPTGFTWLESGGDTLSDTACAAFYRIATGGEENPLTCTAQSAVDHWCFYLRITGAHPTNPINVVGTAGLESSTATHVVEAVTTTAADCLAIAVLSFDGGDGPTFTVSGTGWAKQDEIQAGTGAANVSAVFATKTVASAGTTGDCTITSANADGSSSFQFAIAPAPAAAGESMPPRVTRAALLQM